MKSGQYLHAGLLYRNPPLANSNRHSFVTLPIAIAQLAKSPDTLLVSGARLTQTESSRTWIILATIRAAFFQSHGIDTGDVSEHLRQFYSNLLCNGIAVMREFIGFAADKCRLLRTPHTCFVVLNLSPPDVQLSAQIRDLKRKSLLASSSIALEWRRRTHHEAARLIIKEQEK